MDPRPTLQRVARIRAEGSEAGGTEGGSSADQGEVREDLLNLKENVESNAREAVEKSEHARPVVAVRLGNGETDFALPVFKSAEHREEVYEHITRDLRHNDVAGVVHGFEGWWLPPEHDDGETKPRESEHSLSAIFIICMMWGWRRMFVYPYKREDGEVEWLEPEVKEDFTHNTLPLFRDS